VLAMFGAIIVLFFVPWLDTSKVRSGAYRPLYKQFFWVFVAACIGLGWLGSQPAEGGYVIAARVLTFWYFFHFLVILPLLGLYETPRPRPASIADAVMGTGAETRVGGTVPARPTAAASPETRG